MAPITTLTLMTAVTTMANQGVASRRSVSSRHVDRAALSESNVMDLILASLASEQAKSASMANQRREVHQRAQHAEVARLPSAKHKLSSPPPATMPTKQQLRSLPNKAPVTLPLYHHLPAMQVFLSLVLSHLYSQNSKTGVAVRSQQG